MNYAIVLNNPSLYPSLFFSLSPPISISLSPHISHPSFSHLPSLSPPLSLSYPSSLSPLSLSLYLPPLSHLSFFLPFSLVFVRLYISILCVCYFQFVRMFQFRIVAMEKDVDIVVNYLKSMSKLEATTTTISNASERTKDIQQQKITKSGRITIVA